MKWQIDQPHDQALPDVAAFIGVVNAHTDFFDPGAPVVVARAPGRLDLMGGIADYSGALVLQWPLAVATFAAVQRSAAPTLTILSTAAAAIGGVAQVTLPLDQLQTAGDPIGYEAAQARLTADAERSWVAYVAGVLLVLRREAGARLETGLRVLIHADVPVGKGVSSSASLEVAVMQALGGALGIELDGRRLALLCQMAENRVVGAPCGIMDQMATACGDHGQLLALLCQPAELQPPVPIPPQIAVWGIDSGVRHAVSGSDYGAVRTGAFMGYRILADVAGLPVSVDQNGTATIADDRWRGYLANVTPQEWESELCAAVPEQIDGAAFLARYGGTSDPITRVDPARTYAVCQPTAHPIYEHARVQRFRDLLHHGGASEAQRQELGALMYASHASYGACGLGSDGTDRLVELAQAAGPAAGVYGAKITGGGSGGTVALLARADAGAVVQEIAARYAAETGREAVVLGGSSPGAVRWGRLVLRAST